MEKTTKKKKSKKGLRKRIGIIAVGGLSLVLTVCLSVGATLAWFAGSTWSSKSLYMGGPVYVEMAGRGKAGSTAGTGEDEAKWIGGNGNLDISATTSRSTGTVKSSDTDNKVDYNDILLPGQRARIFTQARVFSTSQTDSVTDATTANSSSGANTTNTSNGSGKATYVNNQGRVTTTTTSVLRARFSIDIEFDPTVGFNNFTEEGYAKGYPVQSSNYTGHGETAKTAWYEALDATPCAESKDETTNAITYTGRRDAVAAGTTWTKAQDKVGTDDNLKKIKTGEVKSIYKWKYVTKSVYEAAGSDLDKATASGVKMTAPFDGTDKTAGGTGYYGVWVVEANTGTGASGYHYVESDAFYKARCNAYIQSYIEMYVNEYDETVERTVSGSLAYLESSLNDQFVDLIDDSSNLIHDGFVTGFTVDDEGKVTNNTAVSDTIKSQLNASWLYIDPSIGNDTNTDEISTSVGGWWYLVEDNGQKVTTVNPTTNKNEANDAYKIIKTTDTISGEKNTISTETKEAASIAKAGGKADTTRLDAKLYEIKPITGLTGEVVSKNGSEDVVKTVSVSFPFVNGAFTLPSDALTNIFANAKITFKVAFQAIQAYFPFTESIDGYTYKSNLLGQEKALSIKNAIPIFNEAFDYTEAGSTNTDSKL